MSDQLDRCRVICHMITSIDGKINGGFEEQADAEQSGAYYMQKLEEYSKSMAIGCVTSKQSVCKQQVELSQYTGISVPEGDYIVEENADRYYISFDRKGSIHWESNTFTHEGMPEYIVLSVLTAQAPKEYLAYLRSIGLPYVIAGEEEMDIPLALKKLKENFGIEQLALCGGGILNGAFLKAGVIDELSIVMYPYIQGNAENRSVMELSGGKYLKKMSAQKAEILEDGGIHLVFRPE